LFDKKEERIKELENLHKFQCEENGRLNEKFENVSRDFLVSSETNEDRIKLLEWENEQ
jgi:hypothetical protein